jgi:hypothetical protein
MVARLPKLPHLITWSYDARIQGISGSGHILPLEIVTRFPKAPSRSLGMVAGIIQHISKWSYPSSLSQIWRGEYQSIQARGHILHLFKYGGWDTSAYKQVVIPFISFTDMAAAVPKASLSVWWLGYERR